MALNSLSFSSFSVNQENKNTRKFIRRLKDMESIEELSNLQDAELSDFSIDSGDIEKRRGIEKCNVVGETRKTLVKLWEALIVRKRILQDQWHQYFGGDQVERTRAYHIWPGNNVFFFRGRLVCGPDPKGLLLTTVSISLSSWIFAVYVAYDFPNHSTLIITFSVILTIIVLVSLGTVSMIDPGIIPRNYGAFCAQVGTSYRSKMKRVIINVNGVGVKLKYCHICKIYRPPRSCHCAVCDNCVEKFDHHCPWIGQCVGMRNYRYYITFLITALIFFGYIFSFSCWRIHQMMLRNGSFLGVVKNSAETLAVASFSFAAICFLGGLACYHIYLVAINQTAYENYRGRSMGTKSPYDKGVLSNFEETLFMPVPPARVDFRAEVTPWWPDSMDSE